MDSNASSTPSRASTARGSSSSRSARCRRPPSPEPRRADGHPDRTSDAPARTCTRDCLDRRASARRGRAAASRSAGDRGCARRGRSGVRTWRVDGGRARRDRGRAARPHAAARRSVMAESTTRKSQRRSLAAEPFEQLDAEAEGEDGQAPQAGETLKQAAVVAAVTAGAGALIGVAKALLERREGHEPSSTGTREAGETREADEPREADEVDADEPQAGAPESAAADEPDWDEEEEQEEPEDERSDAVDDDDSDLDDAAHARSVYAEVGDQSA